MIHSTKHKRNIVSWVSGTIGEKISNCRCIDVTGLSLGNVEMCLNGSWTAEPPRSICRLCRDEMVSQRQLVPASQLRRLFVLDIVSQQSPGPRLLLSPFLSWRISHSSNTPPIQSTFTLYHYNSTEDTVTFCCWTPISEINENIFFQSLFCPFEFAKITRPFHIVSFLGLRNHSNSFRPPTRQSTHI